MDSCLFMRPGATLSESSFSRSHESQGRGGEGGRGGRKEEEQRSLEGEREGVSLLTCALPDDDTISALLYHSRRSLLFLSLSCDDSRLTSRLGYLDIFHLSSSLSPYLVAAVPFCPHSSCTVATRPLPTPTTLSSAFFSTRAKNTLSPRHDFNFAWINDHF